MVEFKFIFIPLCFLDEDFEGPIGNPSSPVMFLSSKISTSSLICDSNLGTEAATAAATDATVLAAEEDFSKAKLLLLSVCAAVLRSKLLALLLEGVFMVLEAITPAPDIGISWKESEKEN